VPGALTALRDGRTVTVDGLAGTVRPRSDDASGNEAGPSPVSGPTRA
jgi:hypothetical protein